MIVYGVVTVILLVLWLVGTCGGVFVGLDEVWEKDEWQVLAAISSGALVAIILWPLVLPLAMVCVLCYGLFSIPKVIGRARRGEF